VCVIQKAQSYDPINGESRHDTDADQKSKSKCFINV